MSPSRRCGVGGALSLVLAAAGLGVGCAAPTAEVAAPPSSFELWCDSTRTKTTTEWSCSKSPVLVNLISWNDAGCVFQNADGDGTVARGSFDGIQVQVPTLATDDDDAPTGENQDDIAPQIAYTVEVHSSDGSEPIVMTHTATVPASAAAASPPPSEEDQKSEKRFLSASPKPAPTSDVAISGDMSDYLDDDLPPAMRVDRAVVHFANGDFTPHSAAFPMRAVVLVKRAGRTVGCVKFGHQQPDGAADAQDATPSASDSAAGGDGTLAVDCNVAISGTPVQGRSWAFSVSGDSDVDGEGNVAGECVVVGDGGARRALSPKKKKKKGAAAASASEPELTTTTTKSLDKTLPATTKPPPDPPEWKEVGTHLLLNADHNYGVMFAGGPLKSEQYSNSALAWNGLGNMKRYTARFYTYRGRHKIFVRDNNTGEMKKLCVPITPIYEDGEDVRYEITLSNRGLYDPCGAAGDGSDTVEEFIIRRNPVKDNHGCHGINITMKMKDNSMVALHTEPRPDDTSYSKAYMKRYYIITDLSFWARFYLGTHYNMHAGEDALFDMTRSKDTFLFFNKESHQTMTTFQNGSLMGPSKAWGDEARFSVEKLVQPYFYFKSLSQRTEDRMEPHRDHYIRWRPDHHLRIGDGELARYWLPKADEGGYGFIRSTGHWYWDGKYLNDDGYGEKDGDRMQVLRIHYQSAELLECFMKPI